MWSCGKVERHTCPEDFQQLLSDIFGLNHFGDPLYRVVWGQTETLRVSKPEGGYEDQTVGGNVASWLIQKWTSPEKWGSRELFYYMNTDPANNQLLFPYPEFGEYQTIHNLGDGQLNYGIILHLMPFLVEILSLSQAQVDSYRERQKELKNRQEVEEIATRMMDTLPTRYGPVSYGRGGCCTSLLAKKEHDIQQVWNRVDPSKLKHVKGLQQVSPQDATNRR